MNRIKLNAKTRAPRNCKCERRVQATFVCRLQDLRFLCCVFVANWLDAKVNKFSLRLAKIESLALLQLWRNWHNWAQKKRANKEGRTKKLGEPRTDNAPESDSKTDRATVAFRAGIANIAGIASLVAPLLGKAQNKATKRRINLTAAKRETRNAKHRTPNKKAKHTAKKTDANCAKTKIQQTKKKELCSENYNHCAKHCLRPYFGHLTSRARKDSFACRRRAQRGGFVCDAPKVGLNEADFSADCDSRCFVHLCFIRFMSDLQIAVWSRVCLFVCRSRFKSRRTFESKSGLIASL